MKHNFVLEKFERVIRCSLHLQTVDSFQWYLILKKPGSQSSDTESLIATVIYNISAQQHGSQPQQIYSLVSSVIFL